MILYFIFIFIFLVIGEMSDISLASRMNLL